MTSNHAMSGATVEKVFTAIKILITKQDEKKILLVLQCSLEKHEQSVDLYPILSMLKLLETANGMYNNVKHTHQIALTA